MSRRAVDLLLRYMPQVIREGVNPVLRQSKRRGWEPNKNQRKIMEGHELLRSSGEVLDDE